MQSNEMNFFGKDLILTVKICALFQQHPIKIGRLVSELLLILKRYSVILRKSFYYEMNQKTKRKLNFQISVE